MHFVNCLDGDDDDVTCQFLPCSSCNGCIEKVVDVAGMQRSPERLGDTSRMTPASIPTRRTWALLVSLTPFALTQNPLGSVHNMNSV